MKNLFTQRMYSHVEAMVLVFSTGVGMINFWVGFGVLLVGLVVCEAVRCAK